MNVSLEEIDDGLFGLVFDRPDSPANVLDRTTLAELDAHLDNLGGRSARGLVVRSAKSGIFVAGADVHELRALGSPEELRRAVEAGQRVFERLAALAFPTAAAIHGACLGGGLELALACDWRIASRSSKTRIGFPEIQLGILPAWGGTTRATRLLGVPAALDLVLRGRRLNARQALRRGLVDEVAPKEQLVQAARERIASGRPRRK
ncbi:MAG: enoyl-CoA hydratase-related protein, partial [Planctomycetota bacterium]